MLESMYRVRGHVRRITANLPTKLLEAACEASGAGLTETLIEGLELVRRVGALEKARRLKGKLDLRIDLDVSRERSRH